jgi:hypothetical protein
MAKMIPQDITHLPANTTQGEKALYRIIQKHTPDDWVCYAGQRLGIGTTPDFLLIGPELGILILEEKSIPINLVKKFTTENWTVIRDGAPRIEVHPLRQARGYVEKVMQALQKIKRLTDSRGKLKFVAGHGCILSSIRKGEMIVSDIEKFSTPPMVTFDPHLVICKNELPSNRQKESDFTNRLKQMTRLFNFDSLNDDDIQTIRGAIFPEVRAKVMADEITDRNVVLESLTVEQEQMARGIGKNDKTPHRQLNGVGGCGKSIILRTRVVDISRANPDWKILVTFFTRSLKNYLGSNMPSNVSVMTIGQSIYKQWKHHNLDMDSFNVTTEKNWADMVKELKEKNLSRGKYQAIFLDESQDLIPPQADYLRHLLSEETDCAFFCGDIAQNIFRKKSIRWNDHGFKFKGRTSNMQLSRNFRNSREIFEFAWDFIKNEFSGKSDDSDSIKNSLDLYAKVETKRSGPTPLLKKYPSEEEECIAICTEINRLVFQEKVNPQSIVILHPNATKQYSSRIEAYNKNLTEKKISTYWLSEDSSSKINYDPKDNHICISTPESGKGLEWDIVFMPSIERYRGDYPNNLRFVAAMRARHILYPSSCGEF